MSFAAHTDHAPRPAGDPDYVPYWAKGEFARKGGYSYTTESGYSLRNGSGVAGALATVTGFGWPVCGQGAGGADAGFAGVSRSLRAPEPRRPVP